MPCAVRDSPLILSPLGRRALFAGDPKQLAPIVQAEDSDAAGHWLGESPFVLLDPNHESTCFLNEQNRMAEPICHVVSEVFYDGRLRVADKAIADADWVQRHMPADVAGLGLSNVYLRAIEQEGIHGETGWYRPLSCDFICNCVVSLLQHQPPASILVLTPFRSQRNRIRHTLLQLGVNGVDISTVHRAQGSERHTVFFDPVRGDHLDVFGDYGERLINVALSRAQARLVITLSNGDLLNPVLQFVSHVISQQPPDAGPGGQAPTGAQAGLPPLAALVYQEDFPHAYEHTLVLYRGHSASILPVAGGGVNFRLALVDAAGVHVRHMSTEWCRAHPELL